MRKVPAIVRAFVPTAERLVFTWQERVSILISIAAFIFSLYASWHRESIDRIGNSFRISDEYLSKGSVFQDLKDIDQMKNTKSQNTISAAEKYRLEDKFRHQIRYGEYVSSLAHNGFLDIDALEMGLRCVVVETYNEKIDLQGDPRWFYTNTSNMRWFSEKSKNYCREFKRDLLAPPAEELK